MSNNLIKTSGFASFSKNFGETSTAVLGVSINVAKKGEEPEWKYLNVKVEADLSEVDFTALEKKRISVSGFISGESFVPKGSDKKVTVLKLVKCRVKELEEGEKAEHSVELETRVSYLREFGENGVGGQMSRSFKSGEDWEYVNFAFSGNREKLALTDGDIVTAKGFLAADFFTPKGSDVEVARPKIVVLEILERKGETSADATPEKAKAKKTGTAKAKETDTDDDEIPF